MAVQTCAALRKFDARSEAASSKIRLFGRHCAMLALSGRAAERDLDDLLLVRLPAPPEGRRAPLQVMDGNCPRLSGVCPWWNAMVARQRPEFDSRENQQRPISAPGQTRKSGDATGRSALPA
jgi:hypothetical protein